MAEKDPIGAGILGKKGKFRLGEFDEEDNFVEIEYDLTKYLGWYRIALIQKDPMTNLKRKCHT